MKSFKKNDDSIPISFNIRFSLLSRFDVIFVLHDYRNEEFNAEIARQVGMKDIVRKDNTGLLTMEMLKKHLLAARDIKPKIRTNAAKILERYYEFVECDAMIDPSRKTHRCKQALYRLVKAYARLMLKMEVTELDAVVIIRLIMENSYSMGQYSDLHNLIEKPLPLGPTENECRDLLNMLRLEESLIQTVLRQLLVANRPSSEFTQFKTPTTYVTSHKEKKGPSMWDPAMKHLRKTMPFRQPSIIPTATQRPGLSSQDFFNEVQNEAVKSTQLYTRPNFVEEILKEAEAKHEQMMQSLKSTPLTFTPGDTMNESSGGDIFAELEMLLQGRKKFSKFNSGLKFLKKFLCRIKA